MRCLFFLLICSLLPQAYAQDDQEDLAYSLGAKLGERLRDEIPSLPLDALLDGLAKAYRNEPLAVSPARMQSLLDAHASQLLADSDEQRKSQLAEGRFLAGEKAKAGVRVLTQGVLVQERHPGSGARPTPHSRVKVSYRGFLADGSLFDQSEGAQWFTLASVIDGWRIALTQMPVGASWRIVIPSAQAYGAQGAGDLIGPFAPLVFELQLLESQP